MLRPNEVAEYAGPFNSIVTDFIEKLRRKRELFDSTKENEVQGLDNKLLKWCFGSAAELLFDERFALWLSGTRINQRCTDLHPIHRRLSS